MIKLRHLQKGGLLFSSAVLVNARKPLERLIIIIGFEHEHTLLFVSIVQPISLQELYLLFSETGIFFVNDSLNRTNTWG